jgi:hypothetical protein
MIIAKNNSSNNDEEDDEMFNSSKRLITEGIISLNEASNVFYDAQIDFEIKVYRCFIQHIFSRLIDLADVLSNFDSSSNSKSLTSAKILASSKKDRIINEILKLEALLNQNQINENKLNNNIDQILDYEEERKKMETEVLKIVYKVSGKVRKVLLFLVEEFNRSLVKQTDQNYSVIFNDPNANPITIIDHEKGSEFFDCYNKLDTNCKSMINYLMISLCAYGCSPSKQYVSSKNDEVSISCKYL